MSQNDRLLYTRILLLVPVASLITIYAIEIARSVEKIWALSDRQGQPSEPLALPPPAMVAVLITLSLIPIIVLGTSFAHRLRWPIIVISGLLGLFHAIHVIEHLMAADWAGTALVAITGALPYILAVAALVRQSSPTDPPIAASHAD